MPKMSQTGMKAMTQKPISKSVGMGEPLVIHVCVNGKNGKDKEEDGDEEDDDDDDEMEDSLGMEAEKTVKKKARG